MTLVPSMHSTSEEEFLRKYKDNNAACVQWLSKERNPSGVKCSKCGKLTPQEYYKPYHSFKCTICGNLYDPIIGTIYQKGGIPIWKWFYGAWMIYNKGGRNVSVGLFCQKSGLTIKQASHVIKTLLKNL